MVMILMHQEGVLVYFKKISQECEKSVLSVSTTYLLCVSLAAQYSLAARPVAQRHE